MNRNLVHSPFEVFAAKRARSRPSSNAQETEKWTRADNQPGEISEKHSFRIASFGEGNELSYLLFRRLSSLTAKKESRVELPLTCTRFSCRLSRPSMDASSHRRLRPNHHTLGTHYHTGGKWPKCKPSDAGRSNDRPYPWGDDREGLPHGRSKIPNC